MNIIIFKYFYIAPPFPSLGFSVKLEFDIDNEISF